MRKMIDKTKRLVRPLQRKLAGLKNNPDPLEFQDMDDDFLEARSRFHDFTMTSVERQYSLWKSIEYIENADIEGDFLECGVWRGGSSMIAALALTRVDSKSRDLWLYDTFEGMTAPSELDVDPEGNRMVDDWDSYDGKLDNPVFAFGSLEEVKKNMKATGYPENQVHFVKGKVEESIPGTIPTKIALLRLDTDWYESTKHELEHLWPLLEPGGVLIIDDYGHWAGARRAVDEYFEARPDKPLFSRVDYTGRVAVKR